MAIISNRSKRTTSKGKPSYKRMASGPSLQPFVYKRIEGMVKKNESL